MKQAEHDQKNNDYSVSSHSIYLFCLELEIAKVFLRQENIKEPLFPECLPNCLVIIRENFANLGYDEIELILA